MTNISKVKLPDAELTKLFKQLMQEVSSLDTKHNMHFFDSLLTKSERIMITKRFTALVMLTEGYSAYQITKILHISPSTADHYRLEYVKGTYDQVVKQLASKKKKREELWLLIEKISRAGMPSMGKDRWTSLRS